MKKVITKITHRGRVKWFDTGKLVIRPGGISGTKVLVRGVRIRVGGPPELGVRWEPPHKDIKIPRKR